MTPSNRRLPRGARGAILLALILGIALFFGCRFPWFISPPATQAGLVASDGTFPDRVRIVWHSAERADTYEVYRAPSETGQYEKIRETPVPPTTTPASPLTWCIGTRCGPATPPAVAPSRRRIPATPNPPPPARLPLR